MAITPDPKAPTRKQLRKFLPDHETVKLFERLFDQVGMYLTSAIEETEINAGTADAKAQQAVDTLEKILDLVELLVTDGKAQQALDLISSIRDISQIESGLALAKAQQAIDLISRTPKTRVLQASGNILHDDDTIEIDASGAPVTATLPSVVGLAGKPLTIAATDVTNNAILASFGAETLPDGTTSFQFLAVPEALSIKGNLAETGWVIA